ncbi:MAG: ABC transporter ATP-binding protein [Myxococcales bacterium]|nr:ABC transporter ATP-binding protein [Myxococcales bacterium]
MSEEAHSTETPALVADAIVVRRGGLRILDGASLRCGPGLFHLTGANASGKSTLLRALAGVLPVARGHVRVAGHDLARAPVLARRALGYMPETADLFPYLRCDELLETVASLRGATRAEALAPLEPLEIGALARARVGTLSFGQRRKLALAAALCGRPRVLLLDEPESGLDSHSLAYLEGHLQELVRAGRTIVVASHRARPGASATLRVEGGRVRAL